MAPLCWLEQSLALGCVKKFVCVARVLVPLVTTLVLLRTISVLLTLQPLNTDSPCSDLFLDFQLDSNLKLFIDFFKLAFLCMSHLLISGSFGMVFEHFRNIFDLKDSVNGFIQLH
jgi:hypothetical protein